MNYKKERIAVKLLTPDACLPLKSTDGAAGFDLFCYKTFQINSNTLCIVNIGIAIQIPEGYYGRIAGRSGLAVKHSLIVLGGVIDNDYTGEVQVILFNLSPNAVTFNAGDRVAQLIIESYLSPELFLVNKFQKLTARSTKGFGSTGN